MSLYINLNTAVFIFQIKAFNNKTQQSKTDNMGDVLKLNVKNKFVYFSVYFGTYGWCGLLENIYVFL